MRAGHFEAAVDGALPVIQHDTPFTAEATLPELIEAAVRSGHQDVARSAFATLADRTTTAGTPWALGIRARCQALLEDGSDTEAAHREAISQLGRSHAAVDLPRAHLLYGQWLRRAKRRAAPPAHRRGHVRHDGRHRFRPPGERRAARHRRASPGTNPAHPLLPHPPDGPGRH